MIRFGGMTKSFRPWKVDEVWLLPPSVQEFVPEGHAAHLVRDNLADGTKLRANSSKHTAVSYARMGPAEAELAAEVEGWLAQAEGGDATEDAALGADRRGDEMPGWMRDKQRRLERIRTTQAELEAEARAAEAARPDPGTKADGSPSQRRGRKPKHPPGGPKPCAQRNFTDPQSRIMKGRDGFVQASNAQAAVDATAQVIVAHHRGATSGPILTLPTRASGESAHKIKG